MEDITHQTSHTTKDTTVNENKNVDFLMDKIEKLSTAVYMVTSYMDNEEPVRKSLRTLALSTVANTSHFIHSESEKFKKELQKDINHVLSLLTLSETTQIMSHMNAHILQSEYAKVREFLVGHTPKVFTLHSFNLDKALPTKTQQKVFDQEASNTPLELKDKTETENKELHQKVNQDILRDKPTSEPRAVIADKVPPEVRAHFPKQTTPKETEVKKETQVVTIQKDRKNSRQEMILSLLSKDAEVSIKDIAKKVKGCSEKTIQRELNVLVDKRLAKRTGEKRWSRYLRV